MRLRNTTTGLLLAAFWLSAGYVASADESGGQRVAETLWPTASWPVSSAEEQGMESSGLARLVETVGTYKQDNLTIIRHGKIVVDAYYAPYAAGALNLAVGSDGLGAVALHTICASRLLANDAAKALLTGIL